MFSKHADNVCITFYNYRQTKVWQMTYLVDPHVVVTLNVNHVYVSLLSLLSVRGWSNPTTLVWGRWSISAWSLFLRWRVHFLIVDEQPVTNQLHMVTLATLFSSTDIEVSTGLQPRAGIAHRLQRWHPSMS